MNLFMHYAFDCWMQRTYPQCPFARYADDGVVHCRSREQAEEVMRAIAARLSECGLRMHPEKSRIVYCKDSGRTEAYRNTCFTFLGFAFRPRKAMSRHGQVFTSFLPAVSEDALTRMRQTVRGWRWQSKTSATLTALAQQCNATIRGWWNYYGAFYRTQMHGFFRYIDQKLERWARRKYKPLRRHKRRSVDWLQKMRHVFPDIFFHWQLGTSGLG